MSSNIIEIKWRKDQLWRGCILAAIAHAIMVAEYPDLSNEHSWDGVNYSVQDSAGTRGTVTFHSEYCVAAFRNDNSERTNSSCIKKADEYFTRAPKEIIKLAQEETLQYLLDNVEGKTTPLITTVFWGIGEKIFIEDTFEEMLKNGGFLLEKQALEINEAIEAWKEYYNMSTEQCQLLESIYKRKINEPRKKLTLTKYEIELIGTGNEGGLSESRNSFGEIGIVWEE